MGAIAAPVPLSKSIPALPTGTLSTTVDSIVALDGGTNLPKNVPGSSIPAPVLVNDASIADATVLASTDIFLVSQDSGATLKRVAASVLTTFFGAGAAQKITIAPIADVATSTTFTVIATATGYSAAPTAGWQYRLGVNGTWTALPSPSIRFDGINNTFTITFTHPGIALASGAAAVYVRDATTTTIVGASNSFTVGTTLPTGLGQLLAWWDASALVPNSFTDTGFATPSVAAGSSGAGSVIAGLKDLSGNGNNLIQATGAAQPFLKTADINGLPTFQFSGAQTLRNTTALGTATSLANLIRSGNVTILCVYKPNATLNNYTVMSACKSATASGRDQIKGAEIRTAGNAYTAWNPSSQINNLISSGTYAGSTVMKHVSRIPPLGGTMFQMINGGTETSLATAGTDTSGGFDNVLLGAVLQASVVTNPLNGSIAEVAIFAGINNNAAATTLATYATAKWGS